MKKLTERQRLITTILTSVALSGGLMAFVYTDRAEIDEINAEIEGLDSRISAAAIEEAKIPDREEKVLVFRAVEDRELAILPTEQKIADFQRGLSTNLAAAGLRFTELPESSPEDSELARGIRSTRVKLKGGGDAASILKFINMIENDPRLVAVKGFRITAGDRPEKDSTQPVVHELELELETYFYRPERTKDVLHIPGAEKRLQEPRVQEAILAFQPERPETYVLRPAASRRDSLVDPRQQKAKDSGVDEEQWAREEAIVADLEARHRDISEKIEMERAYERTGDLFRFDRMRREIDELSNDLRTRLEQARELKSVLLPELVGRLEKLAESLEEMRGARPVRDMVVTRTVADEFRRELEADLANGAYGDMTSKGSAWVNFLRGKQIEPEARALMEQIEALMQKGRIHGEFHALTLKVTGTIVHEEDAARSLAVVNNRYVRVGDVLDDGGDLTLVGISVVDVVFRYQGETIRLSTRSDDKRAAPDAASAKRDQRFVTKPR